MDDKQAVGYLMEVWRRWDFLLATVIVLFSLVFWTLGRRIAPIRALRWGMSANENE